MLRLVAVCGMQVQYTLPWRRLPRAAELPVTAALRHDRVEWVGSQAELARGYPRAAATIPYGFALAAAPISGRDCSWGALILLWQTDHGRRASARERNHIAALVFRHGERFYNFQGLRQYKSKFDPAWRARYLAAPAGLALPSVLVDVTTLVSGGIRSTFAR